MSNFLIALLMGIGVSAWVYSKMYRSTGGNSKNAIISGGLVGLLTFIAALILLGVFVPN